VEEIARALERAGHRVAILHGGHSAEEKARIRQRFDRGEVDIVVASDAGATGANLQKRGEWLVHYDIPMTWKTYEQRTARIDRLGQRKPIEVHTLMTDTDHDRENWRRIREKKLLGDIFHGPYEHMDDRGLALHLRLAGKGEEDAA
jgi:superfamily II DNA/RNA helicase